MLHKESALTVWSPVSNRRASTDGKDQQDNGACYIRAGNARFTVLRNALMEDIEQKREAAPIVRCKTTVEVLYAHLGAALHMMCPGKRSLCMLAFGMLLLLPGPCCQW